jgi:hypothetical protein
MPKEARTVLWWIYALQAFLIVPVLLGAIARDEMSFWPSWNKADGWAVVADVYIHLIFYSAFYVLSYVILSAAYKKHTSGMEGHFFVISVWPLTTVFLFHEPIFNFLDDLLNHGQPVWYQWLCLLWIAFTVCMFIVWHGVSKAKLEHRIEQAVQDHPGPSR